MNAAAHGPLAPPGDHFWRVVVASSAIHAAAVGLALALRPAPTIDLEQKPIVARLVRLGEKRAENLLPRKEQEAAAPAPPSPAPPEPARATPTPAAAPATPPSQPKSRPSGSAGPDAFKAALAKVRRDARNEPIYGDPNGDAAGDAEEGQEGDRYLALVQSAIHQVYRPPATISDRERIALRATIILYLAPDGRVLDHTFESRSANAAFNDALERAVRQARLPPPPPERRRQYREQGLGVNFTP